MFVSSAVRRFLVAVVCVGTTVGLSLHRDAMAQSGGTFIPPVPNSKCFPGVSTCPTCSTTIPGNPSVYTVNTSPTGFQTGACGDAGALGSPIPSCAAIQARSCGDVYRCITSAYIGVSGQADNWCTTRTN